MVIRDRFDVFRRMSGVQPRARYLMFRMLHDGLIDFDKQTWCGGIARLATKVGYSPGTVSSNLRKLVEMGWLAKGQAVTRGRPVDTYMAGPKLTKKPISRDFGVGLWQALCSTEDHFMQLSVPERCLLAQLWLAVQNDGAHMAGFSSQRACALTGIGVAVLAKDVGLGKATTQRLLEGLCERGFTFASSTDFTAYGTTGMTRTYFLLGPAVLETGATIFRWKAKLSGVLGWLASTDEGAEINKVVADVIGATVSDPRTHRLSVRLRGLCDPVLRRYILTCIFAALSNGYFWSPKKGKSPVIIHIEAALLKVLKLPISGPVKWHRGVENMSLHGRDGDRHVYEFVAAWASYLFEESIAILPKVTSLVIEGVESPGYVACYPIDEDGNKLLQLDAVICSSCERDKFRVSLEGWSGLPETARPDAVYVS